jgi:hypothetical protein
LIVLLYSAVSERDAERAKKKIGAAALKTFIRQGYHGTSMRDIATAPVFRLEISTTTTRPENTSISA